LTLNVGDQPHYQVKPWFSASPTTSSLHKGGWKSDGGQLRPTHADQPQDMIGVQFILRWPSLDRFICPHPNGASEIRQAK
jgi:hypothetical protein